MKLKIERDTLADAVGWVSRTVSSRPTLPALGGILLELAEHQLELRSTDLEVTGEARVEVAGVQDGRALVPGRLFAELVRNLPAGSVEVESDPSGLTLRCGRVSHELRLLDADDFPSLGTPEVERSAELSGEDLATAAGQVCRAASHDEARPVLTAVCVEATDESLTLAATDSYRLAVRELGWSWGHGACTALVPARALSEAARALAAEPTVQLALEPHQVTFAGGGRRLTSRLVEGEFIKFRSLLPTGYENIATIERTALADALKQVAPYGQNNNPVRLTFTADSLQVDGTLQDVGRGAAAVDAKYEGEQLTLAFNPSFLGDGVAGVEDSEVVVEVREPQKPALLHGRDRRGFTYVLMPVRLAG